MIGCKEEIMETIKKIILNGYETNIAPYDTIELGTFDSFGIEQLQVIKGNGWEDLNVIATFNSPDKKSVQVIVDAVTGMCDVPKEATANLYGVGTIVFVGLADGVQRISTDVQYIVRKHSNASGTEPAEPTPSVVEQILTEAQNANVNSAKAKKLATDAKDIAQSVRDDADDGKFNGKDGAKGDKGETGTTPQLKIGEDNLWKVSYDNGATWVSLGVKATGAAGKDGAEFTVTDASGTTTAMIRNGTDGRDGTPGAPGKDAVVDATLTQDGQAADAKVTGEKISQLKEDTTALKKRQNVLVGSKTGNPIAVDDAFAAPLCGLNVCGKSTQDGTPTPDAPVSIVSAGDSGSVAVKVTGANILYLPDIEESTVGGITYFVKNGVIKIKGTSTGKSIRLLRNIKLFVGTWFFNPNPVKGTESSNCYLDLTNTINLGFSVRSNNINKPIKITELNAKYPFYLNIESTAGSVIDMEWKPQMLLSDKLLPYSPYCEQLLTIPTPDGLPGIPVTSGGNYTDQNGQQWICDCVDFGRGVKVQRVNAVDLSTCTITGTTNLVATKRLAIRLPLKGKDYTAKALCNRLPYLVSFTSDTIHFYVDINNAQVFIPIDAKKPEEGEYILFYILDAPIETPLTPAEIAAYKALTAYAPDTVVQASDGAGVKLEYQRDVNIAIKKLEDAIASMTTT